MVEIQKLSKLPVALLLLLLSTTAADCKRTELKNYPEGFECIETKQGQTVTVSMDANPTTGYSWHLLNAQVLRAVDSVNYNYEPGLPQLTGSGGTALWSFKGRTKGIDTLHFAYYRSWEAADHAATKRVIIEVK